MILFVEEYLFNLCNFYLEAIYMITNIIRNIHFF